MGPVLSSGSAVQRCLLLSLWLFLPPDSTPDVLAKGGFIDNRTWDESSWMVTWRDREECAKCLMQEDFVKQNCQSREVYSLLPESIEMDTSGALMGWRSPTTTTTSAMASFFPTMSSIHVEHESEHGCTSGRQLWGTQWPMQSQRWALKSHSQPCPTLEQETPCHTCVRACGRPPSECQGALSQGAPPKLDGAPWNGQLFLKMSGHWDLPASESLWAVFKTNFSPFLLW